MNKLSLSDDLMAACMSFVLSARKLAKVLCDVSAAAALSKVKVHLEDVLGSTGEEKGFQQP